METSLSKYLLTIQFSFCQCLWFCQILSRIVHWIALFVKCVLLNCQISFLAPCPLQGQAMTRDSKYRVLFLGPCYSGLVQTDRSDFPNWSVLLQIGWDLSLWVYLDISTSSKLNETCRKLVKLVQNVLSLF